MKVFEKIALLICQLTSFQEAEVQKICFLGHLQFPGENIKFFLEHLIMPREKNVFLKTPHFARNKLFILSVFKIL